MTVATSVQVLGACCPSKVARPRATPAQPHRARSIRCRATLAPDATKPSKASKSNGNGAQQSVLQSYSNLPGGSSGKQRILILGTGWGAMSFIKAFDHSLLSKYELVLLSPRNYFVYTPLLPAMCAGTVEERSIVEPVRAVLKGKVRKGLGTHRPAPSGLLGQVLRGQVH